MSRPVQGPTCSLSATGVGIDQARGMSFIVFTPTNYQLDSYNKPVFVTASTCGTHSATCNALRISQVKVDVNFIRL